LARVSIAVKNLDFFLGLQLESENVVGGFDDPGAR